MPDDAQLHTTGTDPVAVVERALLATRVPVLRGHRPFTYTSVTLGLPEHDEQAEFIDTHHGRPVPGHPLFELPTYRVDHPSALLRFVGALEVALDEGAPFTLTATMPIQGHDIDDAMGWRYRPETQQLAVATRAEAEPELHDDAALLRCQRRLTPYALRGLYPALSPLTDALAPLLASYRHDRHPDAD